MCTVEKRKWSQVDQGSSGSSGGPSSRTGSGSSGDEEVDKLIHIPTEFAKKRTGIYFQKTWLNPKRINKRV